MQDTLKSPPSENKTMKRASLYGVGTTTVFYIAIGCIGYAAFGDDVPGNILTGFQDPFWLVDIANICIIIHLVGAYQVYAQPIFATVERKINSMLPNSTFTQNILTLRMPFTKHKSLRLTPSKLISRSVLIISSTFVAMLLPFFNAVMGFLGAVSFWPLTVYFPINMFLVQRKIKRGSITWVLLQSLSLICLLISIAATIGSIAGIIDSLKSVKLFKAEY